MAEKRIMMATNHRDLGTSSPEQKAAVTRTAKVTVDFIQGGWQIVIVHNSTPQVGMIHTAMNEFGKQHDGYSKTPMSICSAVNQGYVDYDLQDDIRVELIKCRTYKPVSTILTQVTVDPCDETLYTPVKAIGRVMTAKEAEEEEAKDSRVKEVEDGFRETAALPHPITIMEIDVIKAPLDADQPVIVCGGGGTPVMERGHSLGGVSVTIEKDLATGLLTKEAGTDVTAILTSVENVILSYGTKGGQPVNRMTIDQAKDYINQGQSESASMLPKIAASMDLLENGRGYEVIITVLNRVEESLKENGGAVIE